MSKTIILRIEHPVPDFDTWKQKGFESGAIDRKKLGVRRYRILRPVDDPHYVLIDLEFDSVSQAETHLDALRNLWKGVGDRFGWSEPPKTRIVEVAESKEY